MATAERVEFFARSMRRWRRGFQEICTPTRTTTRFPAKREKLRLKDEITRLATDA